MQPGPLQFPVRTMEKLAASAFLIVLNVDQVEPSESSPG